MCGPLKGAICGAIVFEGWAPELASAEKLGRHGRRALRAEPPLRRRRSMTGITTRSMPLLVVENRASGNRAYCTLNEGLGKVMRFGGNDADVLARLAWLREGSVPCSARRSARQAALP